LFTRRWPSFKRFTFCCCSCGFILCPKSGQASGIVNKSASSSQVKFVKTTKLWIIKHVTIGSEFGCLKEYLTDCESASNNVFYVGKKIKYCWTYFNSVCPVLLGWFVKIRVPLKSKKQPATHFLSKSIIHSLTHIFHPKINHPPKSQTSLTQRAEKDSKCANLTVDFRVSSSSVAWDVGFFPFLCAKSATDGLNFGEQPILLLWYAKWTEKIY